MLLRSWDNALTLLILSIASHNAGSQCTKANSVNALFNERSHCCLMKSFSGSVVQLLGARFKKSYNVCSQGHTWVVHTACMSPLLYARATSVQLSSIVPCATEKLLLPSVRS